MSDRRRVAVVGGGVAGLAAARALRRHGDIDVVVLEAAPRPGGVLETSRDRGFVEEQAANGFLPEPDGVEALCDELGVPVDEASPEARRRWIYTRGALHEVPTGPRALVGSDLLSWRGKLSALAEPFRRGGGGDESVAAWARRRLGPEIARTLVAPFVSGVFAGDADALSLEAAFPRLAELERRGGLTVGMLSRQLERMRSGAAERGKPRRPRRRLSAPAGGMGQVVAALADELGAALRTGAPVVAASRDGGGVALRLADGGALRADVAVLATPAYASARIVSDAAPRLAAVLGEIPYAPIAIVYLGYHRRDVGHPLDGFGFLVAPGEPLRMLGTVFESVLWQDRAPPGSVLFRVMYGGALDPAAIDEEDEALFDVAHRELTGVLAIEAAPAHRALVRQRRAIPQYTIGHTDRVARAEAEAADLGVVLAGSAFHGVAVNKLVADAARVVRVVVERLGGAAAVLALVWMATAVLSAGCSGDSAAPRGRVPKRVIAADAGIGAGAAATDPVTLSAAQPYRALPGGHVADAGAIQVTVSWLDPPARVLRSPGRTECGTRARPPVSVTTLGGVRGAVVLLADIRAGRAAPSPERVWVAITGCRPAPVVQAGGVGSTLAVVSYDERRHQVRVDRLGFAPGAPKQAAETRFSLPLVGERFALSLAKPGIWRVTTAADRDDASYVVVPPNPYAAVTDSHGAATLSDVPAGTYALEVWHPPLRRGSAAIVAFGKATVAAGKTAVADISLAGSRRRRRGG